MTATTTLSPTAVTRSWNSVQRALVSLFVIALFATLAFVGGRASVDAHHTSPVIAPAVVSVPALPVPAVPCRVGRPC